MDQIKIQNFERRSPEKQFREVRQIPVDECEELRTAVRSKLHLPPSATDTDILQALEFAAQIVPDARPSDDEFNPSRLLADLQPHLANIYVNWYRFDEIDEIRTEAFCSFFHDLWYPSSDDIEVFDESLKWFLLVRHFDVVMVVRL